MVGIKKIVCIKIIYVKKNESKSRVLLFGMCKDVRKNFVEIASVVKFGDDVGFVPCLKRFSVAYILAHRAVAYFFPLGVKKGFDRDFDPVGDPRFVFVLQLPDVGFVRFNGFPKGFNLLLIDIRVFKDTVIFAQYLFARVARKVKVRLGDVGDIARQIGAAKKDMLVDDVIAR